MRRSSGSDAKISERAPCSGHTFVTANYSGAGEIPTDVGKVASALLAKHVRTLEVLHSLQMDNAKLRQENQLKLSEKDSQLRVANAVSEALKGPNDQSAELRSQLERLRAQDADLKKELTTAKKASTKVIDHAASQMEALREENKELQVKCTELQFEVNSLANDAFRRGELESQLQELSASLAVAQGRAKDLARSLTEMDSASGILELHLKQREDEIMAMTAAQATLKSSLDESRARTTELERESQELRQALKMAQQAEKEVGSRLEETLQDLDSLKKEVADRTTQEDALKMSLEEEKARAITAEVNMGEENRRCHRLQEEWQQRLEDEDRKFKEVLARHSIERHELLARVDAFSRELNALKAHLKSNQSQFSKYVEAKTENNQLKEEIDGLKEMMVAPRPPRRSQSLGGSSISTTLGGLDTSNHVGVDRLRHSIKVTKGQRNVSIGNIVGRSISARQQLEHHHQRRRQGGTEFSGEAFRVNSALTLSSVLQGGGGVKASSYDCLSTPATSGIISKK